MFIDFSCPVESQGVVVKTNSNTGEVYALFKLFNISDRVVDKVVFTMHIYDAYGGELGDLKAEFTELDAQPKSFFAEKKAVSLKDYAEAKHITVEFLEVTYADGETYKIEMSPTEVAIVEPDDEERVRLASVAGADAACYAQDLGTCWVCVCGRPNLSEETTCVRCGREKNEVFEKFSSMDAINQIEEEQQQAAAEAKRLVEERKAVRNKKIKKYTLLGFVTAVCLVILGFLISLAVDGVLVLMGNSAQKKGELVKAYSYYRMADSDKVGEVSEQVRGNSNANLIHSGLMSSDTENLYFVNGDYNIFKESKTTGEKTKISDLSGFFLNVVDGWVYYLDPYTRQMIARTKTDGSDTQHLYKSVNSKFSNMTVVGNDIYYIAQELRDDVTPAMQEQIAQSGQTADLYRTRLYRLQVGKSKPECVSDTDVLQYIIYKDHIYYLDRAETSVYSMELNGKDHKKIVSGPVYDFEISNDVLYYQDGTVNQETYIPKLSLEKAELDGTYIGSVVSNRLVTSFGVVNGAVYYIGFDSAEATTADLYKKTGETEETVIENCIGFNVCEDYLFYVGGDNKIMKSTFDKSGYEEVIAESVNQPQSQTEENAQ